jgi:hypothetical protein
MIFSSVAKRVSFATVFTANKIMAYVLQMSGAKQNPFTLDNGFYQE